MKRRKLLETVGALIGAGAVAADDSRPVAAAPSPDRVVHWVDGGRRCIIARITKLAGTVADLEVEQRPPKDGAYCFERIPCQPHCELSINSSLPRPFTWHEAEGCPCGRAYREWWYGRHQLKTMEEDDKFVRMMEEN